MTCERGPADNKMAGEFVIKTLDSRRNLLFWKGWVKHVKAVRGLSIRGEALLRRRGKAKDGRRLGSGARCGSAAEGVPGDLEQLGS